MEVTDKESDETLYVLATLIAAYSNPQVHPFDIGTLSEDEISTELYNLKELMKEMIG